MQNNTLWGLLKKLGCPDNFGSGVTASFPSNFRNPSSAEPWLRLGSSSSLRDARGVRLDERSEESCQRKPPHHVSHIV